MTETCKKCNEKATWAIDVRHPGPVDLRYETYYACDLCREAVSKNRSEAANFRKL